MAIDTTRVQTIEEIEPFEAAEEINGGNVVLIDTREPHEWDESRIEGAKLVPPATVAEGVPELVPDRSARLILYCRVGNRSARAADALKSELGYENVASIAGGIEAWAEQALPVIAPEGLTPEQRMRYSRHTLLPEVGVEGQLKLLNSKVLLIGAAITWIAYLFLWFGGDDNSPLGLIANLALFLLAPISASLIQLAISRQREYSADATGAEICGNPESLASALLRLEEGAKAMPMQVNQATEPLYIVKPFSGGGIASLFSTHPPIEERVRRLRQMRPALG